MDPRVSDTALGRGRSDSTPVTASRPTAAASAGTAAPGSPGSRCGGTPGVGTSVSRPACGVSPVEYSSGRRRTRRLNHGGDRQANAALHRIFTRLRHDPRTQAY